MVELVDARRLERRDLGRGGSTPSLGTTFINKLEDAKISLDILL